MPHNTFGKEVILWTLTLLFVMKLESTRENCSDGVLKWWGICPWIWIPRVMIDWLNSSNSLFGTYCVHKKKRYFFHILSCPIWWGQQRARTSILCLQFNSCQFMLEWPKQWKLSEQILSWYLGYLYFVLKPPHNVVSQSLSVWFEICQCTNLKFTVYPLVFLKVGMSTISQIFVFEKWDTRASKASNTLTSCVAKVRMLKAQWLLGAEFYIERKKHRPPEQSTLKRQHSTYHSSPQLEKVWTLVWNSLVKICWQHFHKCKFQEVTHSDALTTLLWVGAWRNTKMSFILCPS
jgi:hypothetical protein